MVELIFALFLLSGLFKTYTLFFFPGFQVDYTLFLAIALMGILVFQFLKKGKEVFQGLLQTQKYFYPLIAILVLIFISLTYSSSPKYKFMKTLITLIHVMGMLFPLIYYQFNIQRFISFFWKVALIPGLLYLIVFPSMLYTTGYEAFFKHELYLRKAQVMSSYLSIGHLMGLLSLLVLLIESKFKRFILLNVFLWILIGSSARGPILFTLGCLGLVSLFSLKSILSFLHWNELKALILNNGKKVALFFMIIFAINATQFTIMEHQPKYKKMYLRAVNKTMSIIGKNYKLDVAKEYVPGREVEYVKGNEKGALAGQVVIPKQDAKPTAATFKARIHHLSYCKKKIFASIRSVLFGYGYGSYIYEYSKRDVRGYPHNILMELWFELGVFAMLIWVFYKLQIFWVLIKYKEFLLLTILAYMTFNSLKSSGFADHRIMFSILGIILLTIYRKSIKIQHD